MTFNEYDHPRDPRTKRFRDKDKASNMGALPLQAEERSGQQAMDTLRETMPADRENWDGLNVLVMDVDGKPIHMVLHKQGDTYVNDYNEMIWREDAEGPHANNQIASMEPYGPYGDVDARDQMEMNDLYEDQDWEEIGNRITMDDQQLQAYANTLAARNRLPDNVTDLLTENTRNHLGEESESLLEAVSMRRRFEETGQILNLTNKPSNSEPKPKFTPQPASAHNPWPVTNPELQDNADKLYETANQADTDDAWDEVDDFLIEHGEQGRRAFANSCARGFNLSQYPDSALDRVYHQSQRTTIEDFGQMGDGQAMYHTFGNYSDFLGDIEEDQQ